jgi:hypothetical protein
MSGSSSPSVRAFGGGNDGDDPCSALVLDRIVEALVPGVANALLGGEILDLMLEDGPPEAVALLLAGALAGSIVPTVRLLECLRQGVAFAAEVMAVNGGAVRVQIRAVR